MKYIVNIFRVFFLAEMVLMNVACSKKNHSIDTVSGNMPCLAWGVGKDAIMAYMSAYTLDKEGDDFLCFKGKGLEKNISYYFEDGVLCASMLIFERSETIMSYIDSMFSEYLSLGELDGARIYVGESRNAIVAVESIYSVDRFYSVVGWSVKDHPEVN